MSRGEQTSWENDLLHPTGWQTKTLNKTGENTFPYAPFGARLRLNTNGMSTEVKIGKTVLRLVTGDIAEQDTDAVVTAAHWRLNKGTGTDGTIHTKGGPKVYEECRKIGSCPIGDAVITTGGNLKARHVIHAVGPVWRNGDEDEPDLLASAYRRSLQVAVQNNLRSISFPSISTGAFGYPLKLAAPVALKTIVEFLRKGEHNLDEVRMVLYSREDDRAYPLFAAALEQILAEKPDSGIS